jgi:hypothetical protein
MGTHNIEENSAARKPKRDEIVGPFAAWFSAGFTTELLPIIPPGAPISPRSKVKEGGKTPGVKADDGWVGLPKWTSAIFAESDVKLCDDMGASVGLQGRSYPMFDLDIENGEIADGIEKLVRDICGDAPVRELCAEVGDGMKG